MSIVRWDPFRELEDMNNRLNRVFNRHAQHGTNATESLGMSDWSPAVDIAESAEEYEIKMEVPSVKKEDLKVSMDHGVLRITGERKQEKEEKSKKFHRVERAYGSFLRTFSLPENVDEGKVRAEFQDGVLSVHLLKSEKSRPKTVDVKVS